MGDAPKLLFDTNVWLDYYDPARPRFKEAFDLFGFCCRYDVEVFYAATSMKDVFFIVSESQKRALRAANGDVTEEEAKAISACAWSIIQNMYEMGSPAPVSLPQVFAAVKMRGVHQDFEDDLMIATAQMGGVDFLVANDRRLISKSVVPTLSSDDMLAYLKTIFDDEHSV